MKFLSAQELRDNVPAPADNPLARLQHVIDLYAGYSDWEIVSGTYNVYGPGIRTGLGMQDLREIQFVLDALVDTVTRQHEMLMAEGKNHCDGCVMAH